MELIEKGSYRARMSFVEVVRECRMAWGSRTVECRKSRLCFGLALAALAAFAACSDGGSSGTGPEPEDQVSRLDLAALPGDTLTLTAGESRTISVRALDGQGNEVEDAAITVETSDAAVAVAAQSGQASRAALAATGFTIRAVGLGTASLTFRHAPSGVSLSLSLTVSAPPPTKISLNRSLVVFMSDGTDPSPQTFVVANAGGGTLSWSLSEDAAWLEVSPTSGTNSGTVTLTAHVGGLANGSYSATVTISAPGADSRSVSVSLSVIHPPAFAGTYTVTATVTATSCSSGPPVGQSRQLTVFLDGSAQNFGVHLLGTVLRGMMNRLGEFQARSGDVFSSLTISGLLFESASGIRMEATLVSSVFSFDPPIGACSRTERLTGSKTG
jgi:hypothetical protein